MSTSQGMPILEVKTFKSFVVIHPDHFGFVIGRQGNTVKQIGKNTHTFVDGRQKPNSLSKGWPWIMVTGDNLGNVKQAYNDIIKIASEAERRMPRFTRQEFEVTAPKPRVKLVIKGANIEDTQPESPPASPTYSPDSPTFAPHTPTFAPDSPTAAPPKTPFKQQTCQGCVEEQENQQAHMGGCLPNEWE